MPLKIALPKGRLLAPTAALLQRDGWVIDGYSESSRFYLLKSARFPDFKFKVFHEKDIPIQVAIGNYDIGICSLDWISELTAKFTASAVTLIKRLGYDAGSLYVCASRFDGVSNLDGVKQLKGTVRIASEYPNLAEYFALQNRFSRFNVFPVWGGAEGYPPESAELALVRCDTESELYNSGLTPLSRILQSDAYIIANTRSLETKDLEQAIAAISTGTPAAASKKEACLSKVSSFNRLDAKMVRLALPDGHQQQPTLELLNKAGIKIEGYPSKTGNRRPVIEIEGFAVKVIRPQDMPLQLANGNFDIAITGHDWVYDHLSKFPSSPVTELLDLGSGKVRIVAVIGQEVPAENIGELRKIKGSSDMPVRIATEYVDIADRYARENRLGHYRIVPTWGATEAFLPDDADMIIENTQTGTTIAKNNLKIIDTLFWSTGCVAGNRDAALNPDKSAKIKTFVERLQLAVGVAL